MNKTALHSLPLTWQAWINENLSRGCRPSQMEQIMVSNGKFPPALAHAAIEEARQEGFSHLPAASEPQPLPYIDTSCNVFRAPDREVDILLALHAPRIVLLGNLLSHEECDALIAHAHARLERSPVVSDSDGSTELHAHRTSHGTMMRRGESELVARIEARLAAVTHWPVENAEGMQVLKYEKGNEYRPHFDWFDGSRPGPRKHLERGGQRVGTVVMYLSDVEAGGGTSFPNVGLQVRPKKGSAVFFANTDAARKPDPQTLHAGDPVEQGTKYIATKWLRERVYG